MIPNDIIEEAYMHKHTRNLNEKLRLLAEGFSRLVLTQRFISSLQILRKCWNCKSARDVANIFGKIRGTVFIKR